MYLFNRVWYRLGQGNSAYITENTEFDTFGGWSILSNGVTNHKDKQHGRNIRISRVFSGERKRKIGCSRESDRVVVSEQRCDGTARPAAITEHCNTECELRSVSIPLSLSPPLPRSL